MDPKHLLLAPTTTACCWRDGSRCFSRGAKLRLALCLCSDVTPPQHILRGGTCCSPTNDTSTIRKDMRHNTRYTFPGISACRQHGRKYFLLPCVVSCCFFDDFVFVRTVHGVPLSATLSFRGNPVHPVSQQAGRTENTQLILSAYMSAPLTHPGWSEWHPGWSEWEKEQGRSKTLCPASVKDIGEYDFGRHRSHARHI